MDSYPKIIAKDLSNLYNLVGWAEQVQLKGSYSQRHPNLGKMARCPYCGIRRRELGPKCCNYKFSKENGVLFSRSATRKLIAASKRHRQEDRFWRQIRSQTLRFQRDETQLKKAAKSMCVPIPALADIPSFSEKYFLHKFRIRARMFREVQNQSRRKNHA